MKERPILFSAPMVQAILDGRKTMTRRVVKPQPIIGNYKISPPILLSYTIDRNGTTAYCQRKKCPYGQIGNQLWVRETWRASSIYDKTPVGDISPCERPLIQYRACQSKSPTDLIMGKWRPSIFMPRWASRITLEITNIKVERLQNITETDAAKEGVESSSFDGGQTELYKMNFVDLWDSINGKIHPWQSNPWVWVISFKVLSLALSKSPGEANSEG